MAWPPQLRTGRVRLLGTPEEITVRQTREKFIGGGGGDGNSEECGPTDGDAVATLSILAAAVHVRVR